MTIYRVQASKWNPEKGEHERISEEFYNGYETALAAVRKMTGRKRRDREHGGVERCCEFFTGKGKRYYFVTLSAIYVYQEAV